MSDRNKLIPWLIVAGAPLVLFGPMLVRGEVLFWGTPMLQFVPWRQLAFEMLSEGVLPLWNSSLGMGAPLLANYQLGLLYPPNWLLFVTGAAWGHALLMMLHLILGGWGMIALARKLGLGPLGQTTAGLAFSLSGYLVARAWFISIDSAVAWLPWIILAVDMLVDELINGHDRKRIARSMTILGFLFALQWLAGHAQMAWYTLLGAGAWLLWRAISTKKHRLALSAMLAFLGSTVLAFALAAVQLLPTLEYTFQSQRSGGIDPELALTYSFWPWRILGLLLPDLFGNPAHGNYWGYGNYWEDAIYIGVLPICVALSAAWLAIRKRSQYNNLGRFLVALSIGAILLALGRNTFIYPFLFRHVPTFDLFQAPTRWNLLLVFALSLLAGIGIDSWKTPTGRGLYWIRLGTAGAAVIGVAAYIGTILVEGVEPSFVRAFAIAGAWLFVTGMIILFARRVGPLGVVLLVGVVLSIDLLLAGRGLNPSTTADLYQGESALYSQIEPNQRIFMPDELEQELKFEDFFRFDTFDSRVDWRWVRDSGLSNVTILDGLVSANNFDPLLPGKYVSWMESLTEVPIQERSGLLSLMNIGWLILPHENMPESVTIKKLEGAQRVWFVPQALYEPTDEVALDEVMSPDFDPSTMVILDEPFPSEYVGSSEGEVLVFDESITGEIYMDVFVEKGSWLLLSDTWFPGWRVSIDGAPTKLFRGDYAFRAIWVPPGNHIVEFAYQPPSFWLGALISMVAWIGLIIVVVRWRLD